MQKLNKKIRVFLLLLELQLVLKGKRINGEMK